MISDENLKALKARLQLEQDVINEQSEFFAIISEWRRKGEDWFLLNGTLAAGNTAKQILEFKIKCDLEGNTLEPGKKADAFISEIYPELNKSAFDLKLAFIEGIATVYKLVEPDIKVRRA